MTPTNQTEKTKKKQNDIGKKYEMAFLKNKKIAN